MLSQQKWSLSINGLLALELGQIQREAYSLSFYQDPGKWWDEAQD